MAARLLVLAFRGTIAQRVAECINISVEKMYVDSSVAALEQFISEVGLARYDFVLAMGAYGGRDQGALRIERECTSRFRQKEAVPRRLAIPYFMQPGAGIKTANGIGNSWCNLLSYKILTNCPRVRYTFLHIPRKFDAELAAEIIDEQLVLL